MTDTTQTNQLLQDRPRELISLEEVCYTYMPGTPFEHQALRGVNLKVFSGESVGLIGPTGSGKSTLSLHLNGLLRADSGRIRVCGVDISKHGRGHLLSRVRFEVGLLFQFPEQQLFEESVNEDVAFGPRNQGLAESEVAQRVREALTLVGLDPESYGERSPFALSGGEKRRAALAGVIAMRPLCLVLDEPTAGLDPKAASELVELLKRLQLEQGLTMIVISHRFEELACLVERIVVMREGQIKLDGPVREVFSNVSELARLGLEAPPICQLFELLKHEGWQPELCPINVDEAYQLLRQSYSRLLPSE